MSVQLNIDLPYSTPEAQGISSSAILEFVEALETRVHDVHSFILLRHGNVVARGWWTPYERHYPHMLFSLSKSFTSTAVGLAIHDGCFSLEDSVVSFFPDDVPDDASDNLKAMTVHHLLSMSTGHADDTMEYFFKRDDSNWVKGFFDAPVTHEPGTHFLYNTGATYILSAIVQKTTGEKVNDYLKPRLYDPLNIPYPVWEESPQGINAGGFGLNITTDDIARFGQLYLQKGRWHGMQLIPQDWVEKASSFQSDNGNDPDNDWAQGYGYQFWMCRHNAYRGDGAFGQYCIVMPEQDAVLAMTGGLDDMGVPMNAAWDILLPAMKDNTLPEDTTAQDALADKLSNLAMPPVQGDVTSPIAESISGKKYRVDANALNLECVTFDFFGAQNCITMKMKNCEDRIVCGYASWQTGQTKIFAEEWQSEAQLLAVSGAWINEKRFDIVMRLVETSFYHTVEFHFDDDALTIKTRINVSFMPIETQVLTGRLR